MTLFKICGLGDASHAVVAADAGASFLGFVFVRGVRRQLSPEQAVAIIEEYRGLRPKGGPRVVGLFADQGLEEVNGAVTACGLDMVQLCGQEAPAYWEHVDAPIIRQVRVRGGRPLAEETRRVLYLVEQVAQAGHLPLLDTYRSDTQGGSGHAFDWRIAAEVAARHRVVLAGGLTPENVREAIECAGPWAVDVSSGVETGGVKDPAKIAAFGQAVRQTGTDSSLPRGERAP